MNARANARAPRAPSAFRSEGAASQASAPSGAHCTADSFTRNAAARHSPAAAHHRTAAARVASCSASSASSMKAHCIGSRYSVVPRPFRNDDAAAAMPATAPASAPAIRHASSISSSALTTTTVRVTAYAASGPPSPTAGASSSGKSGARCVIGSPDGYVIPLPWAMLYASAR